MTVRGRRHVREGLVRTGARGVPYVDRKRAAKVNVKQRIVVMAAVAARRAPVLNSKSSQFPNGIANSTG